MIGTAWLNAVTLLDYLLRDASDSLPDLAT
jgi:hypothetical protein